MQTITSRYAPGRSPFARLRRDVRRMVENLRAYEYAAWQLARAERIASPHMEQGIYFAIRLAELRRDRDNQADNVTRFGDVLADQYGPEAFQRIKRIATDLA